jgi:phage major head subunit gpT-like protein
MIINQENLANIYVALVAIFHNAFQEASGFADQVAMLVPSQGRANDYTFLMQFPQLREWIGDRQLSNLAGASFSITNKDYEATIEVDRNDIEDDAVGLYHPLIAELGRNAKLHPDMLVASLLDQGHMTPCYDGQNFFDTDHPGGPGGTQSNYGGGSGPAWYLLDTTKGIKPVIVQQRTQPQLLCLDRPDSSHVFMRKKYRFGVDYRGAVGFGLWQLAYASREELNATNYAAARKSMLTVKNDAGEPLGIMPSLLMVPPSLEMAAKELLKADLLGTIGEGTKTNIWKGTAELMVVPWLKD